ncbi:MAG: polyprenyl synthetase family protein [Acidobacteriota bacterium]
MQAPETSPPARPPYGLQDIFASVEDELVVVEQILRDKVESNLDLVENSSRYMYQSGGKRIRPALLLLSSKLFGYQGAVAPAYGAVVEFIHTATLIHDDIVDEATMRRGQTSVNSLLGNDVTVLLGDYLYIRAIALAIEKGNLKILELICEITLGMIEGMILELTRGGAIDISKEEHLNILKLKTAYLFRACGQIGAILAGATEEEERIIGAYGTHLGMAFQLVDDVLDFTADEKVLGKPVLSDLKEGHITLPIIYAIRSEPGAVPIIEAVIRTRTIDEQSGKEVLELVRRHDALDKAFELAKGYARQARQVLAPLPHSVHKESLLALADYVVERDR